jgi:hypothetical protein
MTHRRRARVLGAFVATAAAGVGIGSAACGSDGSSGPSATCAAGSPACDDAAPADLVDAATPLDGPPPPPACPPRDAGAEAGAYRCGRFASDAPGDWGGSVTADRCGDAIYTTESLFPASGTAYDTLIRKFDADCNLEWSHGIGGAQYLAPGTIVLAVDPAGDLLAYGEFQGTVVLGADTYTAAPGDQDAFLAKLSPAGDVRWTKHFGSAGATVAAAAIDTDPAGDIVLAGAFTGKVDFGGGALTNATTTRDGYVAKLDSSGKQVFANQYHVTNGCLTTGCGFIPGALSVSASGEIAFGGALDGSVDFGGGTLSATGKAVIVKLAPGGTHTFSRTYGTDALGVAMAILRYDAAGNLFASGAAAVSDGLDFGSGVVIPKTSSGTGRYAWLVKFDPAMTAQWARTTAAPTTTGGATTTIDGLNFDPGGNVLTVGWFNGAMDLGDGPKPYTGFESGVFVAKYMPDGGFFYERAFEVYRGSSCGALTIMGASTSKDLVGGALVTGAFGGTLDLGAGAESNGGYCVGDAGAKLFFARYEP